VNIGKECLVLVERKKFDLSLDCKDGTTQAHLPPSQNIYFSSLGVQLDDMGDKAIFTA